MVNRQPHLIVFSSLYPSAVRPMAGLFIRERMTRVAEHCPIVVVSPVPWFPLQGLIRAVRPGYRPQPASFETQGGVSVYFPRFLSLPGIGRSLDGLMMALCSVWTMFKLKKTFRFNLIDAHFAYPDGYAATLLGQWFGVPVTITLRGTEVPLSRIPRRRNLMLKALERATRILSVSESLKTHVVGLGADSMKITVVGNGVDLAKFTALDKAQARQTLNLPAQSPILISVGGLVERKGFHRVIDILPFLIERHPDLLYLIVGGPSPEGDIRGQLEQQVAQLGLEQHVRFLGAYRSEELKVPLSASDVFVLATAHEGWANVFLEAMACGLPVVTTDVGGNREVVAESVLGAIVPFGDQEALASAVQQALEKSWDRARIIAYAADNAWDKRVSVLTNLFNTLVNE